MLVGHERTRSRLMNSQEIKILGVVSMKGNDHHINFLASSLIGHRFILTITEAAADRVH